MESVTIEGIQLSDANIIHDSTKEIFRYPVGAVTCGTKVTLALRIADLHFERATLCMIGDGGVERIDMIPEEGMMRAAYTAPESGQEGGCVLWYWFEIALQGGVLCYYGAEPPYRGGLGRICPGHPPAFQLTVYDPGFDTPDWAKSAVMYQVFPDRFHTGDPDGARAGVEYHRGKGREDMELREDWSGLPAYEAKEGQNDYMPGDVFGGDLEGIRQRLPYLADLGVTLIYLNPIFEAASNHRYNTGDYLKIDPILGDGEAFRRLAAEAGEKGIRIILDGVFSHTGDDSVYFNKYGRYDGAGAYQSADSPYFGWYEFDDWPDRYKSWWGFESLPEVRERDPGWSEFVITGQDSVVKRWIGEGASGYRLDVADELPDETIEQIRAAVKEADPESFLLGEVWEDATTKRSLGNQRTYALGRGLDSVMNYPFLNNTVDFLKGRADAWEYSRFLTDQRDIYPAPMYYALMNLLSSHDVCRIRSVLSADFDAGAMPRSEQAQALLSDEEYILGGRLQRLAAAIQFSLPGVPAVYYGDEVGMTGMLDPFNRRAWQDEELARGGGKDQGRGGGKDQGRKDAQATAQGGQSGAQATGKTQGRDGVKDQGRKDAQATGKTQRLKEALAPGRRSALALVLEPGLRGAPAPGPGGQSDTQAPTQGGECSLQEWYGWLGGLRASRPVMSTGYARFFATDGNVLAILRHTVFERDFFGKEIGSDAVLTVVNPTDEPRRIVLDMGELASSLPRGRIGDALLGDTLGAVSLLTGRELSLEKGLIEIDIPPLGAEVFGVV